MPYSPYVYHEGIEARYIRHIPNFLELNAGVSEEAKLIRLLFGTLVIEHPLTGDVFRSNLNLSIIGMPENSPVSTSVIRKKFTTIGKLNKLKIFLNSTKFVNRRFCSELLGEITQYFHATDKGEHTKAFIHLYRITEFIGYSFPLIYASASRDYYGTFNRLKNYFNTSKSELTFFDSFVSNLFKDNTPDTLATFTFASGNDLLDRSHYQLLNRLIKDDYIDSKSPDSSITITYRNMLNVCVDVRNRYFHFGMGAQRNIHASEILEPDVFFSTMNGHIINWVGVIYFEILTSQLS